MSEFEQALREVRTEYELVMGAGWGAPEYIPVRHHEPMCIHCRLGVTEHLRPEGKCPFAPTTFEKFDPL